MSQYLRWIVIEGSLVHSSTLKHFIKNKLENRSIYAKTKGEVKAIPVNQKRESD